MLATLLDTRSVVLMDSSVYSRVSQTAVTLDFPSVDLRDKMMAEKMAEKMAE